MCSMQSIKRRVAALEAVNQDVVLTLIVANVGHTNAEALRITGLPSDIRRVVFCDLQDVDL